MDKEKIIRDVQQEVADYYNIKLIELKESKTRKHLMLFPRYIAITLCNEYTGMEESIMKYFGRHRTTWYHVKDEAMNIIEQFPSLTKDYNKLKMKCAPDEYINFEDEFEAALNYQFPKLDEKKYRWEL